MSKNNNKETKQYTLHGVRESFICPKCSDGEMIFDIEITHILPIMYYHNCNKCGYSKKLYEKNSH